MYKFCRVSTIIGWKGATLNLRANTVWPADDPFVKAHPELFADSPEVVETSTGARYSAPVEQATAAPGERRAR